MQFMPLSLRKADSHTAERIADIIEEYEFDISRSQ